MRRVNMISYRIRTWFNRQTRLWRYRPNRKFTAIVLFVLLVIYFYHLNSKPKRTNESDQHENKFRDDEEIQDTMIPELVWWSTAIGDKRNGLIQCKNVNCRVINGENTRSDKSVDAYLFYGTTLTPWELPLPRHNRQLWALFHEESPKNNDGIFNFEETMSLFNITATIKRESDMPITMFNLRKVSDITDTKYVVMTGEKEVYKNEMGLAPIVYVQSDCDPPSDRDSFVKLLQKYIPVDSYGKCIHNKDFPDSLKFSRSMAPMHSEEFLHFMARYKFTLSMENYACDDYVTEKLWRTFRTGSVPIVFGPSNIRMFLPSKESAIIINEFDSVEDLAKLIKYLDENSEEYNKYLEYKESGITNAHLATYIKSKDGDNVHSTFDSFECYVCEQTHLFKRDHSRHKVANVNHYGCQEPRLFDEHGKYEQVGGSGSDAWWNGKLIAQTMRHFYDKSTVVSRVEFFKYMSSIKTNNRRTV